MKKRIIYIFFLLILLSGEVKPQKFLVKYYGEKDGLPDIYVNDIAQDQNGRMWFATRNGIGIYDGLNWQYYNNTNGLLKQNVLKLKFDSLSRPWVVFGGDSFCVQYFENNVWHLIPELKIKFSEKLEISDAEIITENNKIVILISTLKHGLFIYKNGFWKNYTKDFGFPSSNINSVKYFDNKYFVATSNGLAILNSDLKLEYNINVKNVGDNILLLQKDENKLWIMGDKNIGYLENNQFEIVTPNLAYSERTIYYKTNLVTNYYNSIIYSHSQSFVVFEKSLKTSTFLDKNNGLQQIGGNKIFLDREMNIWIGDQRGLTKISSMRFAGFNKMSGLYEDEVTSIIESKTDEFLFAHNNGITKFKNGKFEQFEIKNKKNDQTYINRVLDLTINKKGDIYFAADQSGFGKITNSNKVINISKPKLTSNAVSIEFDNNGELFCITANELFKIESNKLKKIYNFGDKNKTQLKKIFFNEFNDIYIATGKQGIIYSKDYKKWIKIKNNIDNGSNNVYSLYFDNEFGILAGSRNGLYKVDGDTLKKFNSNNFSISNSVYFIVKDTLNNLWFGTNKNIIKWDRNKTYIYNNNNGLLGFETNRDAGYLSTKGELWFGTNKGVSKYQKEFDDNSKIGKPIIYIDSITVGKKTYYKNEEIHSSYSNNNLTLFYTLPSLIDEKQNFCRYKLLGFDYEWSDPISINDNHIRFTNLPPGEYILKIQGINSIGMKSNIVESPKIFFPKPFYLTTWFFGGVATIIFFAGYFSIKQIERIRYSKKLETEVNNRTLELKESEKKYRFLLTNLQEGVCVVQDGKLKLTNESLAKMLGYDIDEITNEDFGKFIAPEDLELVTNRYNQRQAGENVEEEYEYKMLHKDGKTRIFVNMNAKISNYEDKIATICSFKDITQSKQSEELLKKLSTAVRQSPNIVIITDRNGEIEYVNPKFLEVTGYEFDEVKNKNINIMKSGLVDNEVYGNLWETILKGKLWKGELINKKKNGDIYLVRSTISPIINEKDGDVTHFLSTQEDITFEKYAEDEIRKNETALNSVLSKIPVMIFAIDKNGKIILAKGKVLIELGYLQEKVVGRNASVLFKNSKEILNDVELALSGASFTSVREVQNMIFEISYSPMFDSNNIYTSTLGVAYNITERKKHELELIEAKEEAEKSNRLKSEFLAQMSHEIRTPINSILSFTSLLKDELKDSMPPDLGDGFIYIENGAKRLIRTIDLILNMSQIQTGTYIPNLVKLDLNKEIISNIIIEFQTLASSKKLDLLYDIDTEECNVHGDAYTLGQIFANLVDNAIKYTNSGEVIVKICKVNNKLTVHVADTGIGISSEFIPALFTPFTQEESGYTRKFEGNGLGLALVKKYVEMNNADISVESIKGSGTKFTVTFN